jgi:P-type E1-E2 ATPase
MITINIPGYRKLALEHLVMDYNGTLAVDGSLIPGVRELLAKLAEDIHLHVITADTFGKAKENLEGINCSLRILKMEDQQLEKAEFVNELINNSVAAIGNGFNDALMLKEAALGIALIQKEGISSKTLMNSDIVCNSINDALDLLLNPKRLIATLRR